MPKVLAALSEMGTKGKKKKEIGKKAKYLFLIINHNITHGGIKVERQQECSTLGEI